jgi:uncharacterized protein YhaN
VPPADHRDRYYLCLHELLEADNGSLAGHIMRESAGGYDVSAARDSLGYSLSTPRKNNTTKAVERAKRAREAAASEQANLHQEEQRLRDLRHELAGVRASSEKTEVLKLAIDFQEAKAKLQAAEEQLQGFPESMAEVRGDEKELLEERRSLLSAAEADKAHAQKTIDECMGDLEASALPEEGPPDELLETLDGYTSRIESLQRDFDDLERELVAAETRCDEARRAIGGVAQPEQAADIDAESLQEISRLVREADQIRGEYRFYAKLEEVLGSADAPEQLEQFRDGIRALQRWLSSADPDGDHAKTDGASGTARVIAMACAVIIAAASIALGVLIHLAWLGLIVVAAMLVWLFVALQPTATAKENRREIYRRDFQNLGVPQPGAWTEDAVEGHLDGLAQQWMSGKVEAEKAREWSSHASAFRELEDRANALDAKRSELGERVGLSFGKEAELFVLMSHIRDWQQASSEVAAKEAQLKKTDGQIQGTLGSLSAQLTGYNFDPVHDSAQAKAGVEALLAANEQILDLRATLESAQSDFAAANEQQATARDAARKLFERLDVEPGDDRTIVRLCERKAAYKSAQEEHLKAENTAQSEQARLQKHPAYSTELVDRDVAELQSDLVEHQRKSEEEADLVEQIHDIETRIREAKKSHDVEEKGAEYEDKLEKLNREREADYRKAAGALLADYVQEQTRDQELPDVFHRARQLFSDITRHKYRLDFHDGDRPEFRAWDTTRRVGLGLDELSSGTRVQLLLAVRVAFVEQQERGLKLPLVLDETLANSDDERARAIIEAVERIGANGRQIFYFTAQHDEVRKWRQLLDGSDISSRFVDLGQITDTAAPEEIYGEEVLSLDINSVPEPGEKSHAEYGAVLGVDGGLGPRMPLGRVHLWYLVDEPKALYRLLKAGIVRWGQLHELAERDGLQSVGLTDGDYARIAAGATALEAQARGWAVGRGKPVTRAVLEDSGAVSSTFIDRVSEVCDELDGEAQALLDALERGDVSRFQTSQREKLEDYLRDHGYLDSADPLSPEGMWSRVLGAVAADISREAIDADAVRKLLARATDSREK